jgi:TolA-binding protein
LPGEHSEREGKAPSGFADGGGDANPIRRDDMIRIIGAVLLIVSAGLASVSADELFDAEAAKQHFNAGLEFYFKKDYKNAIQEFQEAAEIDPENARAYYFMGYSYYQLKDMKKAAETFDRAYEADAIYSPLRNKPMDGNPPPQE